MANYFSTDYYTARERFRDGISSVRGELTSLSIGARGPKTEDLTIDIGWIGPPEPKLAIVHSCGVHGIEAFTGSAIQLQWLDSGVHGLPDGCAVILVHVVNPYGMAWLRRVNEHNVDLNRNCLAPGDAYVGAPDRYSAVDEFLNPHREPSPDWLNPRALWLIWQLGLPALKQAIAGGQYVNPKGLFFGGRSLEDGPRLLQQFVRARLMRVRHLIGIDVHTGLGPFGEDTLLVSEPPGSPTFTALKSAYGNRITHSDPDRSPAYRAKGTFDTIYRWTLPDVTLHFILQEFGTYSAIRVLRALRRENLRFHAGDGQPDLSCGRELLATFAPSDPSWRAAVLNRGSAVADDALRLAATLLS